MAAAALAGGGVAGTPGTGDHSSSASHMASIATAGLVQGQQYHLPGPAATAAIIPGANNHMMTAVPVSGMAIPPGLGLQAIPTGVPANAGSTAGMVALGVPASLAAAAAAAAVAGGPPPGLGPLPGRAVAQPPPPALPGSVTGGCGGG
jgi:hypothetical protein